MDRNEKKATDQDSGLTIQTDELESQMDQAVRQHEINEVKETEQPGQGLTKAEATKKNDYDFEDEDEYRVTKKDALAQIKLLFSRYRIKLKTIRKRDPDQASAIEVSTDIILDAIRLKELKIFLDNGQIKVKQYIKIKSEGGTIDHIIYRQAKGEDTSSLPTGEDVSGTERVDMLLGMMNEDVAGRSTIDQLSPYDLKISRACGIIFLV